MAVVDSLLSLVQSQGAQGLLISSGAAPQLVFANEERALSMPALPPDTVAELADEVASPAERAELSVHGTARCRYETPTGGAFAVQIDGEGASLRIRFGPPADLAAVEPPREASGSQKAVASAFGGDVPVDIRLLELLAQVQDEQASDLLLSSGLTPRMRTGGVLRELAGPVVDDETILTLLAPALGDAALDRLRDHGSVDIALDVAPEHGLLRFRVNLFRQDRGLAAALRPIRVHPPTLFDLDLPEHLYELVEPSNGLVLVTGPAGAGKSTTLVALTEHLNRTTSRHIITLEDPIEYQYAPKQGLVHQRELGLHLPSFAAGLRAALREGPDVILVGEMRDPSTIEAALTAAETGHLVLSTLHSANPWMAIDRMLDSFPGERQAGVRGQLAGVLRAILSQHLLPSTTPPSRVPVYEKLVVTAAAANQIREGKQHQLQSTIQTGRDEGMVSLEVSLAEHVRSGRLSRRVANGLARDPRLLADLVG